MLPEKNGPWEKWSPRKMVPGKNGPRKNGPREKWSPEKCPSKIVLRRNNARKFKRLFHFYQLIPLHTQKDVWRLRHDPTFAPNCRTLKESRKICRRVLGFHRLITSAHSTHTPRCSTPTPGFFPGTIFPRTIFLGDHFSEIQIFWSWNRNRISKVNNSLSEGTRKNGSLEKSLQRKNPQKNVLWKKIPMKKCARKNVTIFFRRFFFPVSFFRWIFFSGFPFRKLYEGIFHLLTAAYDMKKSCSSVYSSSPGSLKLSAVFCFWKASKTAWIPVVSAIFSALVRLALFPGTNPCTDFKQFRKYSV